MRLCEFAGADSESGRLEAFTQFLIGRAKDTGAALKISTPAYISLAQNNGISLTVDNLKNLAQQPPLSNLISNVDDTEVQFRGSDNVDNTQMSVDQARATVDSMAKRVAQKAM